MEQRIAVLTSGGDAPGMNAAVRAVVLGGMAMGAEVFVVEDGYAGLAAENRGTFRDARQWQGTGGIIQQGGTVIGSVRFPEFALDGPKKRAIANLVRRGIGRLVVIGGDGSLTGALELHQAWPRLLGEMVDDGTLTAEAAAKVPGLAVVGLAASIDNDLSGLGMTIGANTALHRISEAIDAINSTAISHQRTFVVEVMGRDCGYLALISALGGGADWVLVPEHPPDTVDSALLATGGSTVGPGSARRWEERMCAAIRRGQQQGRRASIVIVAEGARNRDGRPITSQYVRQVLEYRLDRTVRVTVLGHVQRGGAASALDRNMGTLLGHAAVGRILAMDTTIEPCIPDLRGSEIVWQPIRKVLQRNARLTGLIRSHSYRRGARFRGRWFNRAFSLFHTLSRPEPPMPAAQMELHRPPAIAILHTGTLSAGMNTAVRAATRLALAGGHRAVGVTRGFEGLIQGNRDHRPAMIDELRWMGVNRWATMGGANLATSRLVPHTTEQLGAIAANVQEHGIGGLLIIGGWAGYQAALQLVAARAEFPALAIPIACVPATISNNIPGTELTIGCDSALNNIVEALDKIKQSAVAANRCFLVEVCGRYCGYLALMAGLASGAERVYLHEDDETSDAARDRALHEDRDWLIDEFRHGRRMGLMIRNETALGTIATTRLLDKLAQDPQVFELRHAVLGHLQHGGDPSPFDRFLATMMVDCAVEQLSEQMARLQARSCAVGWNRGGLDVMDLAELPGLTDPEHLRPLDQWWLTHRQLLRRFARRG